MIEAMARTNPNYDSDARRWAAVMRREVRADGNFYFSVRTTGIYCRPSCPAKHALRENVAFHDSCKAAERAGFRACKRCRPDDSNFAARHSTAIARACREIETAAEPPSLAVLAENAGMSRFHFHRLFKQATGVTPREYAQSHRAARVREKLARGTSVTQAIYDAGFNSASHFYATANAALGMAPANYRAGAKHESIRFGTARCALGTLLVAATSKGICAISLGDDARKLVHELKALFPHASFIASDRAFERLLKTVVGAIDRPASRFDLPLDIRGTAFQQRVWQALRKIPAGSRSEEHTSELQSRLHPRMPSSA